MTLRPDDPYQRYQEGVAQETQHHNPRLAAQCYAEALALAPKDATYRHALCVRLLQCLAQSGQLEDAVMRAHEMTQDYPESPDLFFSVGNLMLDAAVKQPAQADAQWLPMAEQAFQRCLEIGERPDLSGTVAGRGSVLAAQRLAILYQTQCNAAALKAEHFRRIAEQLKASAPARAAY